MVGTLEFVIVPLFLLQVTIRVLEGPETGSGRENFLPSWLYWLQLPRYCQIPRTIVLLRTANGSLGFSIVGGNTTSGVGDASASPLTAFSRVLHMLMKLSISLQVQCCLFCMAVIHFTMDQMLNFLVYLLKLTSIYRCFLCSNV